MSAKKLAEEVLKLLNMKLPSEMKLEFIKELCESKVEEKEKLK